MVVPVDTTGLCYKVFLVNWLFHSCRLLLSLTHHPEHLLPVDSSGILKWRGMLFISHTKKKCHICNFQLEFFTSHMERLCTRRVECSFSVELPLRRADSLSPHITLERLFESACMYGVCVHMHVCCRPNCVLDQMHISLWACVRAV